MFLVCGEALFDVYAAGDTDTGLALDARAGGSPFNVAVGLARLGQPVGLLTQVSRDFLGERLMRALALEGVDTRSVERSEAATTLSLVGLDARGVPSYAFYGAGGADRLLSPQALSAVAPGVQAIHVGSYATVVGRTARTQRLLIEQQQGRTLVSYDPNIRLTVEPDLAVWREQIEWMLPRSHLLKVSEEDLALVLPGIEPAAFAQRALEAGAGLVVVTRGSAGAWGWTARAHVAVPAQRATVVDTVGAGDTFQAALLTWLAEHARLAPKALPELDAAALHSALSFAARAAAITCARRGAGLPRRGDLG